MSTRAHMRGLHQSERSSAVISAGSAQHTNNAAAECYTMKQQSKVLQNQESNDAE
jgi:hypothetical protein